MRSIKYAVLSGLLLFLAFGNIFSRQRTFTNFDDDVNFVRNVHIHALEYKNICWMLTEGTLIGVWEPMALFFKAVIFSYAGVSAHAVATASFFLHLMNMLLAGLAHLLLIDLLYRRRPLGTKEREAWEWSTFFAATMFAVHPLRAEVVGWCSAQPYLLGTLFSLLSTLTHLRHRSVFSIHCISDISRFNIWSWWSLFSFVTLMLAIFSKAAMISTAIVPILIDVTILWGTGNPPATMRLFYRWIASSLIYHGPYFLGAALSINAAVLASNQGDVPRLELDGTETLLRAPYAATLYLLRTLLPKGICPLYYLPVRLSTTDTRFAVPAILVTVGTFVALGRLALLVRRSFSTKSDKISNAEAFAFGWLAYLALISPSLGLASSHVCMLAADRYCYTAALFVGIPITARIIVQNVRNSVGGSRAASQLYTLQVLLIIFLSISTGQIYPSWQSSEALWGRVIRVNPYQSENKEIISGGQGTRRGGDKRVGVESSYYNLGLTVFDDGRKEESIQLYEKAIEIRPDHVKSWGGKGVAFLSLKRYKESIYSFQKAVALSPKNGHYRYNLGVAYERTFNLRLAAESYQISAQLNPADTKSRNNLGNVLRVMGDFEGAVRAYRSVLELDAGHERAKRNLREVWNSLNTKKGVVK